MKAVVLLSGGIDSPVAVYVMAKAGVELIALHMDGTPYFESTVRVDKLIERLRQVTGQNIPLFTAPHGTANLEEIAKTRIPNIRCVLCKRFMMRVAEQLANREKCNAIIMGDSMGQVASQTLKNMRVEQQAIKMPIIRPLIGLDKDQIVKIAKEIGTYELSIEGAGPCGIVPIKPSTGANIDTILEAEEGMDVPGMIEKAIAGAKKS
ncbi:MAG: 7-cyano-7-deazaguanine synthase [Thermoplasmata archaeon]|nr:7-cyano-7-deazaguanine synthase [Thermoplasmata archaeon]